VGLRPGRLADSRSRLVDIASSSVILQQEQQNLQLADSNHTESALSVVGGKDFKILVLFITFKYTCNLVDFPQLEGH
jgi:hypothetical protein